MLLGIVDGSGAGSDLEHPNLDITTSSTSSNSLQTPKKKTGLGGAQPPPLFALIFFVLSCFHLFYFDFFNVFFRFLLIFS